VVNLIGKKNTAVFISGKGSNLRNLIKFSKQKNSCIKIDLVISNNKNSKGLIYAKKNKIQTYITNFKNKKISEKKIIKYLKNSSIDLICLAGFMKILSKNFIKNFNNPILNIHPSLLPKYKGLNTHERVLKNKDKYSGATVHLVNSKLDSGTIIMQKKVNVLNKDTPKSLKSKVQQAEYWLYPRAIKKFLVNS
tara:strand:- start:783 stop:1361 length:579 start_codon:yes stop_codon:yes gene_type:complete